MMRIASLRHHCFLNICTSWANKLTARLQLGLFAFFQKYSLSWYMWGRRPILETHVLLPSRPLARRFGLEWWGDARRACDEHVTVGRRWDGLRASLVLVSFMVSWAHNIDKMLVRVGLAAGSGSVSCAHIEWRAHERITWKRRRLPSGDVFLGVDKRLWSRGDTTGRSSVVFSQCSQRCKNHSFEKMMLH